MTLTDLSAVSSKSLAQKFPDRPEKTGIKWAAVALFILAIGSLGAAGYFGGLAHYAGTNILQSTVFKASLIAGSSMLVLSIAFAVISQTHNKASDLASGILTSRIFAPFALAGLTVAGLYAISVLGFGLEPKAWMIGAAVGGGFALGILGHLPFKGKQKIEFELSALLRLPQKNYNLIFEHNNRAKLYLGALPNRLLNDGETLKEEENVEAILSINEPWEREEPLGVSLPYDGQHWKELGGIDYKEMNVLDHTPLSTEALHEAADFIHAQLQRSKNVYVHCRAGVGRSAMAVAAYLIKYVYQDVRDTENVLEKGPVQKASEDILKGRKISTIRKKTQALNEFTEDCRKRALVKGDL